MYVVAVTMASCRRNWTGQVIGQGEWKRLGHEAGWREAERTVRFSKWKRDVSGSRAEELKILAIVKTKIFGTKLTKVVGDSHLPLNSGVKVSWCLTLVAPLFLWS